MTIWSHGTIWFVKTLFEYSLTTCLVVDEANLAGGNGEQSSILICKHTTLEELEETDAQQHYNLHTNKGFIEIHAYRIIEHSVVKLTTNWIVKIAIRFSTKKICTGVDDHPCLSPFYYYVPIECNFSLYLFAHIFGNNYIIGELTSTASKERMTTNIIFTDAKLLSLPWSHDTALLQTIAFTVMEKERGHKEGIGKMEVAPWCIHCSCFGWRKGTSRVEQWRNHL